MMRTRLLVGTSVAILFAAAAACDLNPQPLPPGEQPDGGNSETPAPGSSGGSNSATGGSSGDAATAANPDGGEALGITEGGTDGASDGSSDAEGSDASLDAGDAAD
jgi:hypothetical protein